MEDKLSVAETVAAAVAAAQASSSGQLTIPELLDESYIQPPPPPLRTFDTLETAKSYVADYMRFTGTQLRPEQDGHDLLYKCTALDSKSDSRCPFSVVVKLQNNAFHVLVLFPYHTHAIAGTDSMRLKTFPVASLLFDYGGLSVDLEALKMALTEKFPATEFQFETLYDGGGRELSELARGFDPVVRFVFKLVYFEHIKDFESVRFFVSNFFGDSVPLNDAAIHEYMAVCSKVKAFVDRLVGAAKLDDSLVSAASRAGFLSPENIDPAILNAIVKSDTDMGYISQAIAIQTLSNNMMDFKGSQLSRSLGVHHGAGMAPPEQDFATMEEAKAYLKAYMNDLKVGLVIYKSGKNRGYALYRCERGGKPEENLMKRRSAVKQAATNVNEKGELVDSFGKVVKRRNRQSRKIDCPFKVHIQLDKKARCYKLIVPTPEHNHPLGDTDLKYHPILRKRTEEHLKFMTEAYLLGTKKPLDLKKKVQERFPDLQIIDKDIYNDIRKIKMRTERDNQLKNELLKMQALSEEMDK